MEAFADDKIDVAEKVKFVVERVENTVGKGISAVYQHFLHFPLYFQGLLTVLLKAGIIFVKCQSSAANLFHDFTVNDLLISCVRDIFVHFV